AAPEWRDGSSALDQAPWHRAGPCDRDENHRGAPRPGGVQSDSGTGDHGDRVSVGSAEALKGPKRRKGLKGFEAHLALLSSGAVACCVPVVAYGTTKDRRLSEAVLRMEQWSAGGVQEIRPRVRGSGHHQQPPVPRG